MAISRSTRRSERVSLFDGAKKRIAVMDFRFVEVDEPIWQALLEMYTAVVLQTRYNSFETH